MKYKVTQSSEVITENTVIRPMGFGSWLAINEGNNPAYIDGVRISTGASLDYRVLHPSVTWNSPITISFGEDGSSRKVRFIKLFYTEA